MAKSSGKKGDKKGKKQKVKRPGKKLGALYSTSSGKLERKNRFCPKCGPGFFFGKHQDRMVCGKCHYVEYVKK